jgi:hypothetical protein
MSLGKENMHISFLFEIQSKVAASLNHDVDEQ